MKTIVISVLLFVLVSCGQGNASFEEAVPLDDDPNRVNLVHKGLSFIRPEGYEALFDGAYYRIKIPDDRFVFNVIHKSSGSIEEIMSELELFFVQEGSGIEFQFGSTPLSVAKGIYEIPVEGNFAGEVVKVGKSWFCIGPYGTSLQVTLIADAKDFGSELNALGLAFVKSVRFFQPDNSRLDEWKSRLMDHRLQYYNSLDGGSSGITITDKKIIDLCGSGNCYYYRYAGNFVSNSAYGNFGDTDEHNGSWSIESNLEGYFFLRLDFSNNNIYWYKLEYQDGKTILNNKRFVRIGFEEVENGPGCR